MNSFVSRGNAFENIPDEAKELYRQYKQYCDECSKAYDFTCSGADAKACETKKRTCLIVLLTLLMLTFQRKERQTNEKIFDNADRPSHANVLWMHEPSKSRT